MLETKIDDHRNPRVPVQEEKPVEKLGRPQLDPKIREECYKIFNDVWYDFDEERGHEVKKTKYLQLMGFVAKYKKITPRETGPFSEQ